MKTTTMFTGTALIAAIVVSSFGLESAFFQSADDSDDLSSNRFGYLRPNGNTYYDKPNSAIEADTTTVEEDHNHEESVYPDEDHISDLVTEGDEPDEAEPSNVETTTTASPLPFKVIDEQPGNSCGRSEVIELAKKKLTARRQKAEAQTGGKRNKLIQLSRSAGGTTDAEADYQSGATIETGSKKRRRRSSDVAVDGGDHHGGYEDENTGGQLRPKDRFPFSIITVISLIPTIIKTVEAVVDLINKPQPHHPNAADNTFSVNPGTATPHKYFPWQVTIQRDEIHHCGGALISDNHVLTAASCFSFSQNPEHYRIAFELIDRAGKKGSPYFHEVERITLHPRFHESLKYSNDLAIVKLATPVDTNSKLVPVCLPSQRFQLVNQERMIISGYGGAANRNVGDGLLRMNTLDYLNTQECKARNVHYKTAIDKTMICAVSPRDYENLCNATDFGGPLVSMSRSVNNFVLVGVMSFKSRCASTNHPLVFTSVSQQMGWIEKVIRADEVTL